jgi:hypothetical protein
MIKIMLENPKWSMKPWKTTMEVTMTMDRWLYIDYLVFVVVM